MAYQALYRKWRPLTFSDVTGQDHIVNTLQNEITSGRIAHAYLFCGTRGTGKTSLAKIFARAVNCQSPMPNGDPCNTCDICKGILDGSIMDVNEIDAASNNGVDSIRDIRSEVIYQPANARYRVYIIDEVHMLSTAAFNALLKTLEEPPPHVIFILATTESHKIPATIRSRCQRFDFRRISQSDIAGRINKIVQADGIKITPDAVNKIAYLADGSMRDSLSILEQCTPLGDITLEGVEQIVGIAGDSELLSMAQSIRTGDIAQVITSVDKLLAEGKEVIRLMESILDVMRDLLVCKSAKNPGEALSLSGQRLEGFVSVSGSFTAEELMYCIRVLTESITSARLSSKPKILLETALLRCCKPELSIENDAVLARVAKLEQNGVTVHSAPVVQAHAQPQPKEEAPAFDDVPFPVDDDIPMPGDNDLPWETEEVIPPMPAEEPVFAPVAEEKPLPVVEDKAPETDDSSLSADVLVEKIKTDIPTVRPSLIGAKAKMSDGSLVICQTKSFTYSILCKSEELMAKAAGVSVKIVNTEEEYNSFAATPVADGEDKFAQLLAQKEIFGDKMIIE